MWLFEWNWLGCLWALSNVGVILLVGGMFVGEVTSMRKTGHGQAGANIVIGVTTMSFVSASCLLGVLTAFVWNVMTAMLLVGGALCLVALIFGIASISMRRSGNQ